MYLGSPKILKTSKSVNSISVYSQNPNIFINLYEKSVDIFVIFPTIMMNFTHTNAWIELVNQILMVKRRSSANQLVE